MRLDGFDFSVFMMIAAIGAPDSRTCLCWLLHVWKMSTTDALRVIVGHH